MNCLRQNKLYSYRPNYCEHIVSTGFFMETIDCEFAYIEHRMYTHQKYIRLFVSDIYARRKPESKSGGVIQLRYDRRFNVSDDIQFDQPREYYSNKYDMHIIILASSISRPTYIICTCDILTYGYQHIYNIRAVGTCVLYSDLVFTALFTLLLL